MKDYHTAAIASGLVFLYAVANAEEKPKPAPLPPPYRELWVPADQLESVLAKLPRAVMLTPEQYRTLIRDAEKRPAGEPAEPPAAAVVREVAFEGELNDEVARMVARYTVVSFTDEWSEIPLTLPRTRLAHIEVDDTTALRVAPPPKGKNPRPVLLARGRGEHRVAAEYHLPVTRSPAGNAITLTSPAAASASLELKFPQGVKLESDMPFVLDQEKPGLARFTIPAGTGESYQIRWTARDIAGIPDAAVFQTCSYLYSIDSSRVQADLGMILSSSLVDLPARFEIAVPEGVRVLSVEGSELLSWTRKDDGVLTAVLTGGKRRATDLRVLAERDVSSPGGGDVTVTLPVVEIGGVHRASGAMALIGSEDVRVKNIATGPLTIADPDALEAAVSGHPNFVAGFRFPVSTTPPEVTLSPVRDRFNVQLDTSVSLAREAIYLNRDLVFTPLEGHLFGASLALPEGEELMRITASGDGAEEFSWSREGGRNRVQLKWQQGLVAGNSPKVKVATRRDPEGWFELGAEPVSLTFANMAVAGAEALSGYVAVNFDDSFQVKTVNAGNLEPRDGRTTPVTGKLAWFRLSDYSLELNASRRETEIEAGITAYALPLQSTLEVEGQLELDIRFTPVSELTMKLDPAVGEALRFDSPLLAEKRYDAATGAWTLTFHNELSGRQNLRFRMSLPFSEEAVDEESEQKRFSVAAPVLSVPGAKRVRGTWVMEANTDTELSFENEGLDAIDSLRAPAVSGYRPRHRVIAAFQYRGDAYRLKIAGVRHAPEDLVTTVVDSLRIDTVVSTDGDDRHQALLRLRTSGEQFLEVGLPPDAVLWTLTVDGAAVKPVRAERGVLRIQLPARQGGGERQSAILLKVVYQTPGCEWGGSGRESLAPIRLADRIPVMRTDWLLHLPEGYDYQKFRSNLKEKFQVIDRTLLGQVLEATEAGQMASREVAEVQTQKEFSKKVAEARETPVPSQSVANRAPMGAPHAIEKKLKTIIIPSVEFVNTPLRDCLDFLRARASELDSDPDPMNRGIDIVLNAGEAIGGGGIAGAPTVGNDGGLGFDSAPGGGVEGTPITLKLSNVPLQEALKYTLSLSQLTYKVEPNAIVVVPISAADTDLYTNVYEVPPTFLSAGGGGGGGEMAGDPFAAPMDSGGGGAAGRRTAKEVLEEFGVTFGPGAAATYNPQSGQLIVKNTEDQMELVEAINSSLRSSDEPIEGELTIDTTSGEQVAIGNAAQDKTPFLGDLPAVGRLFQSGNGLTPPDVVPASELKALVLELPNSHFETSDGNGGTRRMSARNVLTQAGVGFPPGTSAAYNFTTERLAVRNTEENIERVREHFVAAPTTQAFAAQDSDEGSQGKFQGGAKELRGFDFRNAGLIPLDFELPQSGRSYAFEGLYAPESIRFRYVNWDRQARMAWWWILVGGLAYWFGPWRRWRMPVRLGLLGVVIFTFAPLVISKSLLAFCNSLLIGWLAAMGLWAAWLVCEWVSRRRGQEEMSNPVLRVLLATAFLSSSAFAADQPAPPAAHTVVVPYDAAKPAESQEPRQFYLDYEAFQRLWKLAKETRYRAAEPPGATIDGGKDHILTNALYRAEAKRDRLVVEGRLTLHTRGKDWQKVPLPFSGASISRIRLGDAPASYQDGAVMIEKPGRHTVIVDFEVPIAEGSDSVNWTVPAASASLLAVTMDSELAEPVINGGLPLVKTAGPPSVFTAALGQANAIEFRRRLKTSGRGLTQPNVAIIDAHLFVTPALERLEASYSLEFAGQEEKSFSIAFDPTITPVRFEIPNLATWRIREGGAGEPLRTLEFELTQPARDKLQVRMVGERLIDDLSAPRTFPALAADAARQEQYRSLLRVEELNLKLAPGPRHRQMDFQAGGIDAAGFLPVATYALAGEESAFEYRLEEEAPRRSAVSEYVFQVGAGKLETIGQFQIRSPGAPLLNLTVELPESARIQTVEGNRVKDWWRTGDELFVRFSGATPEITALLVYTAQDLPADTAQAAVVPFGLPDFEDDQVRGSGLLVAHVTRDTVLRFDQSRQVIREVGPDEVAADFEVLAPLERKRGFRFDRAGFSGTANLTPVEPRFDSSWVMLAQAHESWLRLSVQADVEVTRSAVDRVRFSTAETAPEFRVLSPDVREVRREIVEGRREYTAIFQRFVTDAIDFTLETEIPHAGTVALPDIEFGGATRQERFVIVENLSSDRMELAQRGADATVRDLMPFVPDTLQSAQFFRARPGWGVGVTLEKLETTAGNEAVVLYAELSTAFRANGEEWLKAVYRLQNRSLQFLPVHHAEEADLVSVTVAGREVRADKGEAEGAPVVLVPLIQTRPGQLAYNVEMVFRSRGSGKAGRRLTSLQRSLDDPEIVGLSVERTLWNVYLPEEHRMTETGGNMEEVVQAGNLLEKLQSDLTELENLNGIGASAAVDFETLNLACGNGGVLVTRIEEQLKEISRVPSASQGQSEIRRELEKQKVQLSENRIKMPAFQQRQQAADQEMLAADQIVNWGDNSAALVTRNKDIDDKNRQQLERIENQVRLNDNISIGNAYFNNGIAAPEGEEEAAAAKSKSELAATRKAQLGKLVEVDEANDVGDKLKVLNNRQIGQGGAEAPMAEQKGKAAPAPAVKGGYIDFGLKKAAKAAPATEEPAAAGKKPAQLFFNQNARQRLDVQGDQQMEGAQPAQQQERADRVNSATQPYSFGQQADFAQPTAPQGGVSGREEEAFGSRLGEGFRAQRRSSVAVEFPVEGQAYHFKKLKGHAELRIRSEKPADRERGGWLLLLAVALAALWGVDQLARSFNHRWTRMDVHK